MKPGPELNKLIEEKIFKNKVTYYKDTKFYYIEGVGAFVPHYSGFIDQAWKIVERLEEEFEIGCVIDTWNGEVTFRKTQPQNDGPEWVEDLEWTCSYGDSVPHGICIAALKAVGAWNE